MRILEAAGHIVFVGSLLLTVSWAIAAPGDSQSPIVEGGTQVRVTQAVRGHYKNLRERARPPIRAGFRMAKSGGKPIVAEGILQSYDDNTAMLAVPLTAEQAAVLKRVGAKVVSSEVQIRHHTIFEGRYFQQLNVAPAPGEPCSGCAEDRLTGPDRRLLQHRVGKAIKLVTQRDRDGRTWVVGVKP